MFSAIKTKKISETEVEIMGEIAWADFEKFKSEAVAHMANHVDLPGFRKGHVPENILREKLGPMTILEEMAERAIRDIYPNIIVENKIEAIGRPNIAITKIAEGSPLGFKIRQSVLPEIKLPDYKKIAEEVNKKLEADEKVRDAKNVSEQELNDVLAEIKKAREKEAESKQNEEKSGLLKELSDQEKENVRKNLEHEKALRAKDKRRIALVDAILDKTDIALPNILIERQMDRFVDEMRDNLSRMQIKLEDYLTRAKKTEAEIREGSRKDAEKRVKTQLLLETVSKAEKIDAPKEEVEQELKHILEHYKKADPESARDYVSTIIRNTKVFELLESA
ncbi:MAG TPA: trigger factor [Candidatus Paceibacterota bacterium]